MPLLLLDRDDVIVSVPEGKRYLYGKDPVNLIPGVAELIKWANDTGIPVAVVTNQRGIALDTFPDMTDATVGEYNRRLQQSLHERSAHIDAVYICAHDISDECECRKPKPGLLFRAVNDFAVPSEEAVFVGDKMSDIEAARNAGVLGILFSADNAMSPSNDSVPTYSTLFEIQNFLINRWADVSNTSGNVSRDCR